MFGQYFNDFFPAERFGQAEGSHSIGGCGVGIGPVFQKNLAAVGRAREGHLVQKRKPVVVGIGNHRRVLGDGFDQ